MSYPDTSEYERVSIYEQIEQIDIKAIFWAIGEFYKCSVG